MILCYLADADSVHTQRYAVHFAQRGHTVHVISFAPAQIPGVTVHCLPPIRTRNTAGGNRQVLLSLPTINRLVKTIGPDILHAHYLTSYGLLGALTGFNPLVCTAWGSDVLVTPRQSPLYRLALRYIFTRSRAVTSDAVFMGQQAIAYGLNPAKLHHVPLGVDLSRFNLADRRWNNAPPFTLLSMRFLDANANVSDLIDALPTVLAEIPAVRLEITHHGPELSALQQQVGRLGLQNNVLFRGLLPHNEVPATLRQADIYCSLLSNDATSVNLLEAMACGAFPLVSDIPANREWIEDGQNGFVVPLRQPEALAQKIIIALKNQALREKTAQENYRRICQKANWEQNMETVANIYHKVI